MKKSIVSSLFFLVTTISVGQTQPAICPKHIETPEYPPLARQTRMLGEIALSVTIDADGRVENVKVLLPDGKRKPYQFLQNAAVEKCSIGHLLSRRSHRTRKQFSTITKTTHRPAQASSEVVYR